MSTTTLALPDELTLRADAAARTLGVTPHAFMVEAIQQAVDSMGPSTQVERQAVAARSHMLQSGQGYDSDEVRAYLRARRADPGVSPPDITPWRPCVPPAETCRS